MSILIQKQNNTSMKLISTEPLQLLGISFWHTLPTAKNAELQWFTTVPKWLLIKGHVAHSSAFKFQNYRIWKQKFLCKKCGHTSIAHLSDIQPNNHIIDKGKQTVAMKLSENVSQKHIALDNDISTQTVIRAAEGLFVYNKINFHYLPQNIAFDDFKSGIFATSGMSMILIDSVNHRILDVMKDRGAGQLRAYFNQYSPAARSAVKTITVDLFAPLPRHD